jgi:AraC-like DNA-binding protein
MQVAEVALMLSISQALFLAFSSFLFQRKTYIGKLLLLFAISTTAYLYYLVNGMSGAGTITAYIVGRITYLIPGVIWLLAFALFRHEEKVPHYAWALFAAYFVLKAVGQALYMTNPELLSDNLVYAIFHIVPQIINLGLYVHTISLAVLEYRQDLIDSRRNLRVAFVATLGTFWLWVCIDVSFGVLVRMGMESLNETAETVKIIRDIFVFPSILAVNLMLFRFNAFQTEFSMAAIVNDASVTGGFDAISPKDYALKDRLLEFMEKEKPYRQSGLTIGKLAEAMNVREYRLRSVINRVLKFNNFSHFLNKYRIKESEYFLASTDDSIFSIGMDTGYTSLSSFHKAFKEKHAITPKEYRTLSRGPKSGQNLATHSARPKIY